MPKKATPLHPSQIKKLPPGKHADGFGLYLVVAPTGAARWWSWRGMVLGRRVEYGLGRIEVVPLADARAKAREYWSVARGGDDPLEGKRRERGELTSFEEVARELWRRDVEPKGGKHSKQWITTLERHAFPTIGNRPVGAIVRSEIFAVLDPIWRKTPETARRVRQRINAIFSFAIGKGYRSTPNPVDDALSRSLGNNQTAPKHHRAVTVEDAPDAFARIMKAEGMGARALSFAILTAARSGEVRGAKWTEFDGESALWSVPADRMKARRDHIVPFPPEAASILRTLPAYEEIDRFPKVSDFVFPSGRVGSPLSDMTLAAVMKRLKIEGTPHGWRSTFRDWGERAGKWNPRALELCLAHVDPNRVQAAYLRDDLIETRKEILAEWANYLLGL